MLQESSLTSPRMSQASLVWWLDLDCWHRFLWKKHVSEDILNDVIGKGDKQWHVGTYYMWFPPWHMWYIWWSFQVALCGYPRFGWYFYVERLRFLIFIHTKRSIYLRGRSCSNCKLFLWIIWWSPDVHRFITRYGPHLYILVCSLPLPRSLCFPCLVSNDQHPVLVHS